MDAESLTQIEQIVTTALSGREGTRRQETEPPAATLRHGLSESLGAFAASFREMLDEKMDEFMRHDKERAEELCHRLDLVLESQRGLHTDMDRLEATVDQEFHEAQALIRSMIDQSNPQSKTQSRTNPT